MKFRWRSALAGALFAATLNCLVFAGYSEYKLLVLIAPIILYFAIWLFTVDLERPE